MIMEMVGNRSFTFTTGNGKRGRLRRLKNGVPQGYVLAPLFNIYISVLSTTVSRKYAHAADLAIMHADGDWQAVEGVLTNDIATVGEYLHTWKLKLSNTKTVSSAFHLNKEAVALSPLTAVLFMVYAIPFHCVSPLVMRVSAELLLVPRLPLTVGRKKPCATWWWFHLLSVALHAALFSSIVGYERNFAFLCFTCEAW